MELLFCAVGLVLIYALVSFILNYPHWRAKREYEKMEKDIRDDN